MRFDSKYEPREQLAVRIRYRSTPVEATIEMVEDGNAIVHFAAPVSALTPGQSAVIYDGDIVVGGGIIEDPKLLKKYSKL